MREPYRRYFRTLLEFGDFRPYFRGRGRPYFARIPIDQLLFRDRILSQIPKNWRDDAKYFLTTNVEMMVVFPYLSVNESGKAIAQDDRLWSLITEDIDRIKARAEEVAKDRGRSYVSATSVAKAIGELVESLATTSLQIWGPADEDDDSN